MLSGLNGLDYAIVAIVTIGALHGLSRGALRMATSIMSLALGIYAASIYYGRAANLSEGHLHTSPTMSMLIGYAAVFAIVFIAVEYAGARAINLVRIVHLNWADRLAGAVFGAGIGAIFAGLGVVAMTAILPANPALLRDSKLAPRVLRYNEALLAYVPPQIKTEYEQKRKELMRYWTERSESPDATPSPAKQSGPP
jgi:uncharacterized membrane protein required for colicin V production